MFGDVSPVEVIMSLGPLWTFASGHQDAHELFHVVLSALQTESQPTNRKGCLSDALPNITPVRTDMKGSGDPLGLRSVSCNDITTALKDVRTTNGMDKNCIGYIAASTKTIGNVSNVPLPVKPGMILARSSEIISGFSGNKILENGSFRPWNSLCAISLPTISEYSMELHPFSGLLTSQLQCTECKWKSAVRYDKFDSVSLPLPPAGGDLTWRRHTLYELLARLVSSEVIQDVQCDGCGSRCTAFKTLTLGKLPKSLCLHIPRTTWSHSGMPVKRDDPVLFPETLFLDSFTFTETKKRSIQGELQTMAYLNCHTPSHGRLRYRLRAVVEHRGQVDAGHFVCYRRGNRLGQWLYTSDSIVEKVTITDVLSASPYLIFYERMDDFPE
ncbi:ubiquitin carboxyl-terminal hydrolase 30 homolog isoform X2 [Belonocnema kinseyi]|nr:ubiquitin carboxyl-terminal hydrolase 30 homolog isoform X2 [Belonocnema kinseyi]